MAVYTYAQEQLNPTYIETVLGLAPGTILLVTANDGNSISILTSAPLTTEQENKLKSLFFISPTAAPYLFPNGSMQIAAGPEGVGLSKITVGTTPDLAPSVGDLWVDTN